MAELVRELVGELGGVMAGRGRYSSYHVDVYVNFISIAARCYRRSPFLCRCFPLLLFAFTSPQLTKGTFNYCFICPAECHNLLLALPLR